MNAKHVIGTNCSPYKFQKEVSQASFVGFCYLIKLFFNLLFSLQLLLPCRCMSSGAALGPIRPVGRFFGFFQLSCHDNISELDIPFLNINKLSL